MFRIATCAFLMHATQWFLILLGDDVTPGPPFLLGAIVERKARVYVEAGRLVRWSSIRIIYND